MENCRQSEDELLMGLDIGGTKSALVLGRASGLVVAREEWASEAQRGPEAMLDDFCVHAKTLQECHGAARAVGASIGGPLNAEEGIILSPPNLPGWDKFPLLEHLRQRFALPVNVEHDAAACALAEYLWGNHAGAQRLIYLTCGTGFGSGIIIDGKPYYGAGGASPEIGHIAGAEDGPFAFGKTGSYEAFCSARSLGRIAAWKYPSRWPAPPQSSEIDPLAFAGDPDALEVVGTSANMTGRACALLADLLRPDVILLGSLAIYLGQLWTDGVHASFRRHALPAACDACHLGPHTLEDLQDKSSLAAALSARADSRPAALQQT